MKGDGTRRHFLRSSAGFLGTAAAQAVPKPVIPPNRLGPIPTGRGEKLPPEHEVRERPLLSALLSTPGGRKQIEKMMGAYDNLRARNPDTDRTGLFSQMWLHDSNCGGPGGLPDIHSSWAFLPWHRAFLYFHERMLRSMLGQDFRLPVWDWDNDVGIPAEFQAWAQSWLRPYRITALHNVNRCSIQAWLFSSDYCEFAGYKPADSGEMRLGSAVQGVHAAVHTDAGGILSNLALAAGDPLFYAHHANVDRFWVNWRRAHPDFTAPDGFLDQTFTFYDENGEPRFVRSGALMDEQCLGYFYGEPPFRVVTTALTATRTIDSAKDALDFFSRLAVKLNVIREPAEFLRYLEQTFDDALSFAADDLMLPFSIDWLAPAVKPGTYYFIAVKQPGQSQLLNIAGFGVFRHGRMPHVPVSATGCLTWQALTALARPGSVLGYGPDSGDGTISNSDFKSIWPAQITILNRPAA